ncbi:MAG: glycosyltransferase N-terminal domain-containing protein [Bacteroidota bacterium]
MRFFYDIGIRIYWLLAWIISPWNRKAGLWIKGRRKCLEGLQLAFAPEDRVIWFHCASLGEFEQGRPVIEATRSRFPGHKILLSFFSPSGYEKRKSYAGADYVMYLPLDTRRNAIRMLSALQLEMVLFIKYEFWYHFLKQLKSRGVPVFLISGNFRREQIFFKWYGGWYRSFLEFITHIFVQKENSEQLLAQIGISRVSVAGDTRFDRVKKVSETEYRNKALEEFARGSDVIVAGSTWEKDEEILEQAFRAMPEQTRWIIAPHELSEAHLGQMKKHFPESLFFTEIGEKIPSGTRVIIVDTIGHLSYLYRYGTLAYIGGGFGKGIHNILEAATYGQPIIFGPVYRNFIEAVELVSLGGAYPVEDSDDLLSTIHQQLQDRDLLKTSSETAAKYVTERLGATSKIVEDLCKKTDVNMF